MKEIKIVLNNDPETVIDKPFSIFIDDKELKNVNKFTLTANTYFDEFHDVRENHSFYNCDKCIKYTVDYFAPYFEE